MIKTLKIALLAVGLCALVGTPSHAQVNFSITVAPPLLPVYEQPLCPEEGYLWTPGYWDYDDGGYFWVPGAWVEPPRIGFLWTPGYWGFNDGFYVFNRGYWGPRVGFYGGVNYGCGYGGYGYGGGVWRGSRFVYNTAVTRVDTRVIHNTYIDRSVRERATASRASFNGRGGVNVRPTAEQRRFASAQHLAPTRAQVERRQAASRQKGARAAANGGRPATLATDRVRVNRQATRAENNGRDGQPNRRETQRFENRDPNIQRQTNRERRVNGGNGLLPEERQLADRRERRAGREVYQGRQDHRQTQRQERQVYEGGRRAEARQMQREAGGQRQFQAQPPQRQERQAPRGGGERHERGRPHDGQGQQ